MGRSVVGLILSLVVYYKEKRVGSFPVAIKFKIVVVNLNG